MQERPMMKRLLLALSCGLVLTVSLARAAAQLDAPAERAAAVKAEQSGDWDAALLHYENIYDSTLCTPEEYVQLRRKFEELQPKVKPNDDPAKAAAAAAYEAGDMASTSATSRIRRSRSMPVLKR